MTVPNVGDILMLSQVAWRTGRSFTACRKDAPAELQNIEIDVSGLAQALKYLAEILHAESDPSLISQSDQATRDGIGIILSSCQRTVHDLDSLVDRYQVIRKHRTPGGFAIERSWSDLVLAQYETVIWTTEGGGLHDLSNLLQMHTKSIRLLAVAVQSESLSQLEGMVTPMAKRFDSMYDLPGSLEDQLEEVSRFVQELALANTSSQAPPIPQRNPARSPTTESSDPFNTAPIPLSPPALSPRRSRTGTTAPHTRQRSVSAASLTSTPTNNDTSAFIEDEPSTPMPDASRTYVSESSFGWVTARDSTSSYASSHSSTRSQASLNSRHTLVPVVESLPLSWSPEISNNLRSNTKSSTLLPPSLPRPTSAHSAPDISRNKSNSTLSPFPARQNSITKLHRSSTTASQKAAFERDAFRNSAILCDVRGTLVEYSQHTQPDSDNPSEAADIEMVPACEACRIAVVRKRVTDPETKRVHVKTSIWALSSDDTTRVEVPLPSDASIPYSSYFSPTKVSLTTPSTLRFHDIHYGNRLLRSARSSWINFLFDDAAGATLFQNEIMGQTLLATFRTTKTMRIHEGMMGRLAYQEQMCALENLRVWEDPDTGAVVALIHFSASFREGWFAFCINSRDNVIKVADAAPREVKIRGLHIPVAEAGRAIRKDSAVDTHTEAGDAATSRVGSSEPFSASAAEGRISEHRTTTASAASTTISRKGRGQKDTDRKKIISGARIEFATEAEKREFLDLVAEYQRPERLCDGTGLGLGLVGGE